MTRPRLVELVKAALPGDSDDEKLEALATLRDHERAGIIRSVAARSDFMAEYEEYQALKDKTDLRASEKRTVERMAAELAEVKAMSADAVANHQPEPPPPSEWRERLFAAAAADHLNGGFHHMRRFDPFADPTGDTAEQLRARALAAVEGWRNSSDDQKQNATVMLERVGADYADPIDAIRDIRGVSAHIVTFSNPAYVSAFQKYVSDPETFVASLTEAERSAWAHAREIQRTTLDTSGAVLPSPLDPSITLTNAGTIDPMRTVARVDTTVAKEKRYIVSAGSTFSYDAEGAEVSDDTPTLTEKTISVERGQGWIEASFEAAMDQPGFASEVGKIIADARARLEGSKWISGTGTNEPKGIEVALAGGASEVNAAGEALAADDVYGLIEALPVRWRANARWQLELSTINHIARLYNPSGTEPPLLEGNQLARRPYVENSNVDPYSAVNAAATATNRVLFIGDWSKYVILDRVGMSVYYVGPGHLKGANGRPDGRVGWYCVWRNGADVLTIDAFRMLDVQTAA